MLFLKEFFLKDTGSLIINYCLQILFFPLNILMFDEGALTIWFCQRCDTWDQGDLYRGADCMDEALQCCVS